MFMQRFNIGKSYSVNFQLGQTCYEHNTAHIVCLYVHGKDSMQHISNISVCSVV